MRRIMLSGLTIAAIALGSAGAMAQNNPPPPVSGGSGSQVTNPAIYRNNATKEHERSMMVQQRKLGLTTGSANKHHTAKKPRHTTTHKSM